VEESLQLGHKLWHGTNKMKSEYNANRWSQAIIRALWDIFDFQWTTRNSAIHRVNLQDAQEKALALDA
jgi:hypothetical protein